MVQDYDPWTWEPISENEKLWIEQFRMCPLDDLDFVIGVQTGLPVGLKSE